jgi:RHS repeat-associated protein
LTQTAVTTYTYDAANRLTHVGDVAYTWVDLGRLVHDGVYTYTWDGLGQVANGTFTTYTLDVGLALPEVLVAQDGNTTRYLHVPHSIATDDGTGWSYSLGNHLSSVRQQVDGAGQVASVLSYEPFGLPLEGDGGTPYGFTGEWWEADTNQLLLHARWYTPQLGRFVSPDPITADFSYPPSIHKYLYVYNNAVNLTDPSGSCPPGVPECRDEHGRPIDAYYIQCPYTNPGCYVPTGQPDPETWDILQDRKLRPGNIKPFCDLARLDPNVEQLIKRYAAQYGVPWQIVAGVLKSEIELDTELRDIAENLIVFAVPQIALNYRPNPGPGVGNVHLFAAKHVSRYFADYYPQEGYMEFAGRPLHEWDDVTIIYNLVQNELNVEVVTAFVRQLADYRFGSNGQPSLEGHSDLSVWTLTDAAVIWHAYRYGAREVSLKDYDRGFRRLSDFQDRDYTWVEGLQGAEPKFIGWDAESNIRDAIPFLRCYLEQCDE